MNATDSRTRAYLALAAICVIWGTTYTAIKYAVIDFHPFLPQVLISSPCSGHGFKFSSAIGEIQADLVTKGKADFDLSPFRLGRWVG